MIKNRLPKCLENRFNLIKILCDFRILLFVALFLFSAFTLNIINKQVLEAESAEYLNGAFKVVDITASDGYLVSLTKPGAGITFKNSQAARKLAIRYSSLSVGLINISLDNQPVLNLNIHSSGSLTSSFLYAVCEIEIPAGSKLTISLVTDGIEVNIDQIVLGDKDLGLPIDIWNLPPLTLTEGRYPADWRRLSELYTVPEWWRDAKFGVWSHWDPQSMPEQGDWYARGMYIQGHPQYEYNLKHFGHPSEFGYKDICHNWVIDRWRPEELMELYIEMGARYFMAMGVHHENFDCWNSEYQPWNSVNIGPKQDIVGIWEKTARRHGMRFGIGFHNTPARTWGQFMPVRYNCDKTGPMKGVPYDALQSILDGKGKWWEGMDPVDLYGPVHNEKDPLHSPFANQFMWRVDDAITKYHPDVIYFDEHAGDSQVDLGVQMGLGFLAPQLIANYYNKALQWNNGKLDAVINLKGVGGRYNSFQNSPELLPFVDRSLVKSNEVIIESEIMAYPFQTETSIAAWHYQTGQEYLDAATIIHLLLQNVSRNGSMLLNITQHGRGDLDSQVVITCKDVGKWLKTNGEAVYGSRPFEVFGEDSVYYTRKNGKVYAAILNWKGNPITLKALSMNGNTIGKVSKVELLGSNVTLKFLQNEQGLTIMPQSSIKPLQGIINQQLASKYRVLRITHDKGWINDDDPGASAPGWFRHCNLNTGDFNNDLTTSNTPGDTWSCSFTGNSVAVVAPMEEGAGTIEILIDEKTHGKVNLSIIGKRKNQQMVSKLDNLGSGNHTIKIVNCGPGPVAVDALIIK